jgi:glycosyltransferase involved in cell wall biosynthesis
MRMVDFRARQFGENGRANRELVADAVFEAADGARSAQAGVSVVIPTKNEARNIVWVLERLPDFVSEVIVVDASTDDTVAAAKAARPDVRVIGQERPGKGAALRAGFAAASGEFVVMLDADGSMDPAEIGLFIDRLQSDCDFVKGSRFAPGGGTSDMGLVRRTGNAALRSLVNVLYGRDFTDLCYGFCAFRRSGLRSLVLNADGFEIETEIVVRAVKAGLRIDEVPSFEARRRYGDSNLSTWRDGRRVLQTLVRERFAPDHPAVPEPLTIERPVPAGWGFAV